MSRHKKTDAQRRADKFDLLYRMGKAKLGLSEPEIAKIMGIGPSTLRKYKTNPCKYFSIAQFDTLSELLGWTDEEYLSICRNRQ